MKKVSGKNKIVKWMSCVMAAAMLAGCAQIKEMLPFFGKEKGVSSSQSQENSSSEAPVNVDPNWPVTIGDISLLEEPATIVSLSPALTEIVCELGGQDKLAGISDYCDYPPEITSRARFGTTSSPAVERILEIKPGLVISSTPLPTPDKEALESAGIPSAVFSRGSSLEDIEKIYGMLGTMLWGMEDGARIGGQTFGPIQEKYQLLQAASATKTNPYSGVWLRAIPLLMATGDSWENTLLTEVLHVTNDAAEYSNWEYPEDKAADLYPDVIFYDESIPSEFFGTTQIYSTTDAYKQKRMYAFDAVPFERQSGRFVQELHKMLLEVYPDLESMVGSAEDPAEISEDVSSES